LAARFGCSVKDLAVAWVLAKGADIVALVGARQRPQLAQAVAALDFAFTPAEMAVIETIAAPDAPRGARYPEPLIARLDSERG
jgi:aryl-alcohol dehydrogenase-like predicted oxidoreductase